MFTSMPSGTLSYPPKAFRLSSFATLDTLARFILPPAPERNPRSTENPTGTTGTARDVPWDASSAHKIPSVYLPWDGGTPPSTPRRGKRSFESQVSKRWNNLRRFRLVLWSCQCSKIDRITLLSTPGTQNCFENIALSTCQPSDTTRPRNKNLPPPVPHFRSSAISAF